MKPTFLKKTVRISLAVIGMTLMSVTLAPADDWTPAGPMNLMIAFPPGGGSDTQARLIASELEARHGWKIIPKNIGGGGGAKMAAALKKEPNDGLSFGLLVTESIGYNMVASKNPGYTLDDFTPLTTTAGLQMGIVSLSDKGWNSFEDVVAAAKSGEPVRFGVMSPKLADLAYLLGNAQGAQFNIISVKGGRAVMNGINAGDMDVAFMGGIQAKGVAAGNLVNLASALSVPLTQTPSAPTLEQLGVSFHADGYFMFIAPAGIPPAARETISSAIADIITDETTKAGQYIKTAFGGATVISGAELDAFLAQDSIAAKALLTKASQ